MVAKREAEVSETEPTRTRRNCGPAVAAEYFFDDVFLFVASGDLNYNSVGFLVFILMVGC